jgi:quercetin dioxygenase-like cupin family protein
MVYIKEDKEGKKKIVDVRSLPPHERHSLIFEVFDDLPEDWELLVVNDHEPVHLLHFMRHDRQDFDSSSYKAYQVKPGEWVGVFRKKRGPSVQGASEALFTSFSSVRSYSDSGFSPVPVYSAKDYRVLLVYLKAGQFIPVHSPRNDLVFVVHSGEGEVVGGSEKRRVGPGDVVVVRGGVRRGVRAFTDMEALHLVAPPPTDQDHEEVAKKLQAGVFE